MAENTIEIEVELKGRKTVEEGLETLKSGSKDVGEGFKGLTSVMDKSSAQIGEGLSTMSEAVGDSVDAFKSLGEATSMMGTTGKVSLLGMIGPIGLVTTAVAGLWEGFRQLTGMAKQAEEREQAMAAAAADLESKLESLAEGGVTPTGKALKSLMRNILDSQVAKEELEKRIEKLNKKYFAYRDAVKATEKAQKEMNSQLKDSANNYAGLNHAVSLHTQAKSVEAKAYKILNTELEKLQKQQEVLSVQLAKAAKLEEQARRNTYDVVKAKVDELIGRKKAIEVMQAENETRDEEIQQLSKIAAAENERALKAKAKQADDEQDLKTLRRLRDELEAYVKANEQNAQATNAQLQADKVTEAFQQKRAQAAAARAQKRKADQMALLALEQKRIMQQSQLNQLDIKLTKEGDAELLALARERYETGLQLAKDDAMKRAIVLKQYQLETQTIRDQAEAREHDRLKRQREASRKMQAETAAGRKKQMEDEVKAQIEMVANFQNFTKELTKSTASEVNAAAATLGQIIDDYGKGFARATAEAILFGDVSGKTFKQATGEILKSLAIEASVQALMKGAQALAMLFVNPVEAGNLAASAAAYGAAAAAARAGAGALGVGGGGTAAGGGTTASPSGAPQVAGAPQREQAETRETVVNINFGGAVIYDSQEAARRAMMNELVRTYNSAPRGSARFNMGR